MPRLTVSPAERETELERAAPEIWQLLLPAAALALDVGVAASGASNQTIWYVIRASGVMAYVLLALTVVCGLLITNRLLPAGRPRVDLFEIHSFMALLVLAFGGFHALALLLDNYVGFSARQIVVPFTSTYRPVAVALGILGFYASAVIYASFWARRRIGYRTWRSLHYGSFVIFVVLTFHGVLSGADAGHSWMIAIYAGSILVIMALTLLRLMPEEAKRTS